MPRTLHPFNVAPGPKGLPIFGNALTFAKDPRLALMAWARQYGPVVRFHLGPMVVHVVSEPRGVKHVLQTHAENYHKAPRMGFLSDFLGQSLLTMEDTPWQRRRRLAQPSFSQGRVVSCTQAMTAATLRMVERWQPHLASGRAIDVNAEMMRLTLSIAGETLFGVDLSTSAAHVGQGLPVVLNHVLGRMNSVIPTPLWVPTPANRRYHATVRQLDGLVLGLIRDWRSGRVAPQGLMATLMAARDAETGEGLTDDQLRDEVMTLIFAGHETTASALTWAWWLLGKHPEAARRVRAEVATVLGGRTPQAGDVARLQYTGNVIKEAMRLMPPSWVIGRMPLADDEIGGYHIPARSMMLLASCVTHRDPALWEAPESFDPDRFLPGRSAGRPKLAYYPFSAGPRVCIGSAFSMLEATLIVAILAQNFRFELDPRREVEVECSLTLRPKHGLWMTLHPAPATGRVELAEIPLSGDSAPHECPHAAGRAPSKHKTASA